ncbi:SDR family NAD(P)-dependent oxidoreductase [Microbacterium tumbae]
MTRIADTVVLVTGAAERAGAAIARGLAAQGATVYINHTGQAGQAAAVVAEAEAAGLAGRIRAVEADITDETRSTAMIDLIVAEEGRLDVLVHNASTFRPKPFLDLEAEDVDSSFGVNLRGPLFLSRAAARRMIAQGRGRILAIIGNSLTEAWPELVPHVVAKTGLARLMEQLAVALSPHVQCNSIAPTQFHRSDDGVNDALRLARGESPAAADITVIKGIPVRETSPGDVLDALIFLIEAPASITGVTLRLDGGRVHI